MRGPLGGRGRVHAYTSAIVQAGQVYAGGHVPGGRPTLAAGLLLMALARPAAAQGAAIQPDSAHAQIRAVLRGSHLHLAESELGGALGLCPIAEAYRTSRCSEDLQMVRQGPAACGPGSSPVGAAPMPCPSSTSPKVDEAGIRLDGGLGGEASVPRCSGTSWGADR